jgi:Tfp pilus assembly protein PilF
MGYTLALQDRDEEALEYFEDALKIDDKNPFTYIEMYKIYKKMGDEEKAKYYHDKAIEIDENFRDL